MRSSPNKPKQSRTCPPNGLYQDTPAEEPGDCGALLAGKRSVGLFETGSLPKLLPGHRKRDAAGRDAAVPLEISVVDGDLLFAKS